jgi:hypothetical protein
VGHPDHCTLPTSQYPDVEAFVEKFLLGDTTVNTNIAKHPFPLVDYSYWTKWWGTGTVSFPFRDADGSESVWLEPECGIVGQNWEYVSFSQASNKYYVKIKTGLNSTSEAPTDSASIIYLPFTVKADTTFHVFARVNCQTTNSDSYWIKMDDGTFTKIDGLTTTSYMWHKLGSYKLTQGNHTFAIAYCEEGAKIDKICISDYPYLPMVKGEAAANICTPVITDVNTLKTSNGYSLGQNYPNPFNNLTSISFEVQKSTYVSLKVYNILGVEVAELAGKMFAQGRHTVEFDSRNLAKGIYFYTIKTDGFSAVQNMMIKQ